MTKLKQFHLCSISPFLVFSIVKTMVFLIISVNFVRALFYQNCLQLIPVITKISPIVLFKIILKMALNK